jgi:uncharacterized protein YjbI with pentapeptide repeats
MQTILSPQLGENLTEGAIDLAEDGEYADCHCCADLSRQHGERATFRRILFKNAVLSGTLLANADIGDVRFENCDLSNLVLAGATVFRAEFLRCRLTGLDLSAARLRNVVFKESGGQYVNFRFSRIEKTTFVNCTLQGVDFQSATISKSDFKSSDLTRAQLSGVPLNGIDLSDCAIDGLCARPEDLRGAVIAPEQAMVAAQILGITIKQ